MRPRMGKNEALFAVILVASLATAGSWITMAKDPDKVTGEVIDSACYIKAGARGADHARCAADCAKAGIPLAILTDDGKVVWVASTRDMETANALLLPYVAKKVTLEGQWFERGGTKLFAVSKVSEAPAK